MNWPPAEKNQIPIAKDKRGEAPFSVDANLLHTSSEGKVLEDPAVDAPDYVYQRTVNPEDAPNEPEYVEIGFERGDAVSINGEALSPATILTELIYNGFWFSPERTMLQAAIDASQTHVTGTVRLKLYKGSARTVGRWSEHSLYSEAHVTFEDDAGAYDQTDAAGFIQLNALRLKLLAARDKRLK